MSTQYTNIDLSKLPAPELIEELDFETILSEMLEKLQVLDPTFDALVESDPAYKILQVAAYREMGLRQRINDVAKSRMLAYAIGSDLDHVGADREPPVVRLDGESDDQYRERIIMAPEGWSTAGPRGAYNYHARSAHAKIKDARTANAGAGVVQVAILSVDGDGSCYGVRVDYAYGYQTGADEITVKSIAMAIPAGTTLEFENGATFELDEDAVFGATGLSGLLIGSLLNGERGGIIPFVQDALSDEDVRPMGDVLRVIPASIVNYTIEAELTLYDGPDTEVVRLAAEAAATLYAQTQHKIGRDITISGLMAALHQEGVQEVNLISPAARIEIDDYEAPYCTDITVSAVGRDE